ncbi:MAG: hypothetical protein L3J25_04480 [Flavobacteriaceae bacterium]|nr:hypothetical protein [Flavobacteriaceae bacterium]
MTAVIGILNKNAIAIAADSAVTVSSSNGRKIYNTANKIFTLSKFHPVSIIIYNSANFITTPWEIIIKIYRDELNDKSFPKLKNYSEDFFAFLKRKKFFTTPETNSHYFKSFLYHSFDNLTKLSVEKAIEDKIDLIPLSEDERLTIYKGNALDILNYQTLRAKEEDKLEDFKKLTKKKFNELTKKDIDDIFTEEFPDFNTVQIKKIFMEFVFQYIKSKTFFNSWTGLVFAGYGETEIYPVAISTKISDVFDDKIRFYTDSIEEIDDGNDGSIMPFAQRDVIDTLISGISPEINDTLFSTFNKFLNGYNEHLINLLKESQPKLAKKLEKIDINDICNQFIQEVEEVKLVKHIRPTVNTVSILSKEDLSEMAESLIYLTYLKRRISSDEESVGGPVDVALISKGDGFIWIKRKHYFEEKYNPHFINNYYKK